MLPVKKQGRTVFMGDKGGKKTMIAIRTIMNVLPEKQKEVLQTLLSLIAPLEKEKGCLSYDIYRDIEDEGVFNLISEWESRQSLDDHMRSDRFSVLRGIKSLLCKPLKFQILTVLSSEGIEAVKRIRKKRVAIEQRPLCPGASRIFLRFFTHR